MGQLLPNGAWPSVPGTRAEVYPLDPDGFLGAGDIVLFLVLLAHLPPFFDGRRHGRHDAAINGRSFDQDGLRRCHG
nr:hypothetical protein XACG102_7420001 [Xanthomonas citri pv. citri]